LGNNIWFRNSQMKLIERKRRNFDTSECADKQKNRKRTCTLKGKVADEKVTVVEG
jgi:hypothetical protein